MSMIVICPGCCADMIAGKDNGDRPSWHCPICGFTDAPLVREMQLWKDAYDRGFQR
jgi:rubrerythrin